MDRMDVVYKVKTKPALSIIPPRALDEVDDDAIIEVEKHTAALDEVSRSMRHGVYVGVKL